MNLNDLADTLSSSERIDLARSIERAIMRLNPDHDDAHEILDALMASLKRRYSSEQIWDVEHYATYFGQALERIPLNASPEVDECAAYKDYVALYGERD